MAPDDVQVRILEIREKIRGRTGFLLAFGAAAACLVFCVVARPIVSSVSDALLSKITRSLALLSATLHMPGAAWSLGSVDSGGTWTCLALVVARLVLVCAPVVVAARRPGLGKLGWLLGWALGFLLVAPMSLSFGRHAWQWLLLVALSVGATLLARSRSSFVAVLPLMLFVGPAVGYLSPALTWLPPGSLWARCAHNDGARPSNLEPEMLRRLSSGSIWYQGVTATGTGRLLLTRGEFKEGKSWSLWLDEAGGGYRFAEHVDVVGKFWSGCLAAGRVWLAGDGHLLGVPFSAPGASGAEAFRDLAVSTREEGRASAALMNVSCSADQQVLYSGETVDGGLWQVRLDDGTQRRHAIGGVLLQSRVRPDGRVVLTNSSELMVFDTKSSRVLQRMPAGLANVGLGLCPADGAVAVADYAGRLRVFAPGADGRYRFSWSLGLFAPRQVAFSPDCRFLAVASGDGETVSLISRDTQTIRSTYTVGPALREVVFLGPNRLAITDVCSLTTIDIGRGP